MLAEIIRFECPICTNKIKVLAQFAGKTGHCPRCGSVLTVPSVLTTGPSVDAAECLVEAARRIRPLWMP